MFFNLFKLFCQSTFFSGNTWMKFRKFLWTIPIGVFFTNPRGWFLLLVSLIMSDTWNFQDFLGRNPQKNGQKNLCFTGVGKSGRLLAWHRKFPLRLLSSLGALLLRISVWNVFSKSCCFLNLCRKRYRYGKRRIRQTRLRINLVTCIWIRHKSPILIG